MKFEMKLLLFTVGGLKWEKWLPEIIYTSRRITPRPPRPGLLMWVSPGHGPLSTPVQCTVENFYKSHSHQWICVQKSKSLIQNRYLFCRWIEFWAFVFYTFEHENGPRIYFIVYCQYMIIIYTRCSAKWLKCNIFTILYFLPLMN